MKTIEQMVQQEINCCLSSLIATLAIGDAHPGTGLAELCDRALGLAMAVPDYEEAAIQDGWEGPHKDKYGATYFTNKTESEQNQTWCTKDWQSLCEAFDIDPVETEVAGHWAVSQWLAERLLAQGEKVDTDFAGLNVWACTTSGPQTSGGSVIERIYKKMMEA